MPDNKSPLEQALDLFVYAPLGLALTAREELPKLAEKGRTRVSGQMMMAKMIGQFAVSQGQREAEKQVKKATGRLSEMGLVGGPAPTPSPRAEPGPAPMTDPSPAPAPAPASAAAAPTTPPAPATTNGGGVPPVDQLAIPGYDALSASQVVQRLAGLSADELEAVARYESATRHRKTILSRVSQLQSTSAQ
jgi:hypothetical protein